MRAINDLLARLDQGRPLDAAPVELATVAEEAVDAARAMEPGRPLICTEYLARGRNCF